MKAILLLFAANAILLFSCQQGENKHGHEAAHEHVTTAPAEQNLQDRSDENKKWKTDESTRKHVMKLQSRMETFKLEGNADFASYKAFGADLSAEVNNLISGCKMEGPAHDALHTWLTPFLDHLAGLNKSETTSQGKLAVEKIEGSLRAFDEQFE